MLLSLRWLKEFVPYTGTTQELGDALTMVGLELEGVQRPFEAIEGIVVGHVKACEKHPEADKLSVCSVDVGTELLQIVCGAPNIGAGQNVPVAMVGFTMPDGLKIKKAKLRGVESCGMICSERELGLSEEHKGILVLPEGLTPGQKIVDALSMDTEVLEIGITPNRADCFSVLGLAREVALIYKLPLTLPEVPSQPGTGNDVATELPIELHNTEICPAYVGRVLENVRVQPSPAWLRYRLHAVGVRAISNIVDITNYVLMELGQPLHAFDRSCLQGSKIIVSPAVDGESIVTLDNQKRALRQGDIVIRDAQRPVALGGVMGGLESEITEKTTTVFVESALFRPASIRRTARRLGLNSEASFRFERGVDPEGLDRACERAVNLMIELCGCTVRKGICRTIGKPWEAPSILFRQHKCDALLGIALEPSFCRSTLESLGCHIQENALGHWTVSAPSWRYDLNREVDLVEEVARIYGMDNIPTTLPVVRQELDIFGKEKNRHHFQNKIKHWASGLGLSEVINYSFVGHSDLDHLGLPRDGRVDVLNPLSAEQDVLRTEIASGLLQTLRHNIAHGAQSLHLFEVAQSFKSAPKSETTVAEQSRLAVLLYGLRHDSAWPHKDEDLCYADLRGVLENLLAFLHLPQAEINIVDSHAFLTPAMSISCQGMFLGFLGRVKPAMADAFHARKEVWLAEINLDALRELALKVNIKFQPLSVYPPVRRDITIMAPDTLRVDDILQAIPEGKNSLLDCVELLDIYLPKDKAERNLTFRLTFRHTSRTLQDAEVDKERNAIAESLIQNLGVRI